MRGLASNPKLILLDGPAAGMNSKEKEGVKRVVVPIIDRGVSIPDHQARHEADDGRGGLPVRAQLRQAAGGGHHLQIQTNPEVIKAYLGGDE